MATTSCKSLQRPENRLDSIKLKARSLIRVEFELCIGELSVKRLSDNFTSLTAFF